MKVYSETKTGSDGQLYSVRYLLDAEELFGLQAAKLIGPVDEVIGMQEAADLLMAGFEKQQHQACGGTIQ